MSSLSKKDLFSYGFISVLSLLVTYLFTFFSKDVNGDVKLFFFGISIGIMVINIWYIKTLESLSQKKELEKSLYLMNENSKMLFAHYHRLEEKEKQTRLILHDIKNHLQILEKTTQEAGEKGNGYLNEVKNKINELTSKIIVNRKILNILFLEKIEEASIYDIKIEFFIEDVDTTFISDFDIVTIFSNVLDNAIEAVKELNKENRKIDVYIKKINDFLMICEMNPCANILAKNKGKIVTSKKGHTGLGLQNIEQVLQKYGANMVVEIDKDLTFSNTIIFTFHQK